MPEAKPDIKDDGHSGYFIVAFIDMLGTDAINAEIKAQPEFPSAMLEKEVRKVKTFQRNFYCVLNDMIAGKTAMLASKQPEYLKGAFERLKGNDVKSYAFSDSIIFYASLNTKQNRMVPVESCFTVMAALACVQLWSLSRGHPFRGGIEIGRAAEFNDNQILGPALSDAVMLEKQAQFPRILIGEETRKYLELNNQLPSNLPANSANRKYAESCMELICESDEPSDLCPDGCCNEEKNETERVILSLDVCSDFVANLIGGKHQELITKARQFAEIQIQRFTGQEGNNEKLACRYRHLLSYLSKRTE